MSPKLVQSDKIKNMLTPDRDPRLMGSAVLIVQDGMVAHTETKNVLLIKDEPKTEVSAGLNRWYMSDRAEQVWGLVAGGRATREDGRQETLKQLLEREAKEEIGFSITNVRASEKQQQVYPFIVGQRQIREKGINQIGVTSLKINFDSLPIFTQRRIQEVVKKGNAVWLPLQNLRNIFAAARDGKEASVLEWFRPQSCAAAFIWELTECQKVDSEEVIQEIVRWNQKAHAFIRRTARDESLIIRNGSMTATGTVRKYMDFRDERFLLPQEQRLRRYKTE